MKIDGKLLYRINIRVPNFNENKGVGLSLDI